MTRPSFLMLGHGYSAAALAARLPDWRVLGTTRTPGAALRARASSRSTGPTPAAVDAAIAGAEAILVSIPPADGGDPALRRYGQALAAGAGAVGRVSLDHGGLWRPAGRLGGRDERARRR